MLSWQLASVALVAARGHRRPLALGQDRRAAGSDDRLRLRRRLRPRRRGQRARPPPARGAARHGRRGARPSSSSPPAAGRPGPTRGGRLEVVATTTVIGDWVREVGGDAVSVDQVLRAEHRPARVRAAAQRHRGRRRRLAGLRQRRRARRLDRRGRLRQRQRRRGRRPRRRRPGPPPGRGERAPRRPRSTRTGGTTRATPRPRCARSSAGWPPPTPPAAASSKRNADRYLARLRALDRGIAACFAAIPAGPPQAGHRPRRLRLLRPPLRDRGGRRGDPLADDPGAALGQGPQRAGPDDRGGERHRDLPGELAEPEGRRGDRRPDRRLGRPHPLRRLARPAGLARGHLPGDGGGQRRRDGRRLHRREARVPAEP